jgi:hypothetical protein
MLRKDYTGTILDILMGKDSPYATPEQRLQ